MEPELRNPYPVTLWKRVFTDIQFSFPFFHDESTTTNKPKSSFKSFGAIVPEQKLEEEKVSHL
jgi:hypothetical protein